MTKAYAKPADIERAHAVIIAPGRRRFGLD